MTQVVGLKRSLEPRSLWLPFCLNETFTGALPDELSNDNTAKLCRMIM